MGYANLYDKTKGKNKTIEISIEPLTINDDIFNRLLQVFQWQFNEKTFWRDFTRLTGGELTAREYFLSFVGRTLQDPKNLTEHRKHCIKYLAGKLNLDLTMKAFQDEYNRLLERHSRAEALLNDPEKEISHREKFLPHYKILREELCFVLRVLETGSLELLNNGRNNKCQSR